MGWTLSQFEALPEREQIEWLARDRFRQDYLDSLIAQFQKRRPKPQGKDDGMTSSWTPEVAALLLSRKV